MLFNQCFTFKPANITLCQRLLFVTLILSVLSPWGQCTPIVCDAGQTLKQHWLNGSCLLRRVCPLCALRMRGTDFTFRVLEYFCMNHEDQRFFFNLKSSYICLSHPPGSKSWHSEAVRPSLAELAIPSTYWGREGDLDIEYSLVFQKMSF